MYNWAQHSVREFNPVRSPPFSVGTVSKLVYVQKQAGPSLPLKKYLLG